MTEIDPENRNLRDRKNKKVPIKENHDYFQRTITVEVQAWKDTADIPGGRAQAINEFLKALAATKYTDLQVLEREIEDTENEVIRLQAKISSMLKRANELRELEAQQDTAIDTAQKHREQAATNCYNLLRTFNGMLMRSHYDALEKLSGVSSDKIKIFVISKRGYPTESELQEFFTSSI